MIRDDLNRVGDYDFQPNDRPAPHDISEDERMDNDWLEAQHTECRIYEGSLADDCLSIVELGAQMEAFAEQPQAENLFDKARRLNEDEALLQRALNSMYKTASALPHKHLLPKEEK